MNAPPAAGTFIFACIAVSMTPMPIASAVNLLKNRSMIRKKRITVIFSALQKAGQHGSAQEVMLSRNCTIFSSKRNRGSPVLSMKTKLTDGLVIMSVPHGKKEFVPKKLLVASYLD
jgi:hypothetical protein